MPSGTPPHASRGVPDDIDRHVGDRIRERRRHLGLNQQQLADRLRVTYQQVHKYEKGVNRISVSRLYQIARALGVEPGWFFQRLEHPKGVSPSQHWTLEVARTFEALENPEHKQAVAALVHLLRKAEERP